MTTETLTNAEMDARLHALAPLLERRDIIGYAAARNARLLRGQLTEYCAMRDALVLEHGDSDGEGGASISPDSPGFAAFAEELGRYAALTGEVEVFAVPWEEAAGRLTGTEMLSVEWMFKEGGAA